MKKSCLDITWLRDVENTYEDNNRHPSDIDGEFFVPCRFTSVIRNVTLAPFLIRRNHGINGVFMI